MVEVGGSTPPGSTIFLTHYFRSTLFQNFEYPYLTTTNGAKEGDIMNLARAANLYYPGTLKKAF